MVAIVVRAAEPGDAIAVHLFTDACGTTEIMNMARIIVERRGGSRVHRVEGRLDRSPTHPGEILREEVFPAMRVSVAQAARDLRVSRQYLHRILRGEAPITPDMAVKVGKLVGNGPGLWLRMQQAHDLWHAQRRLATELKRIPTRGAAA